MAYLLNVYYDGDIDPALDRQIEAAAGEGELVGAGSFMGEDGEEGQRDHSVGFPGRRVSAAGRAPNREQPGLRPPRDDQREPRRPG